MTLLLERSQTSKIIFARAIFLLTVSTIIYLFYSGHSDYGVFTIIISLFFLFPSITEIKIFNDKVEIKIYNRLATAQDTYILRPENTPVISTFEIEMKADTDAYIMGESILSFMTIFYTPKTIIQYYKIKYIDQGIQRQFTVRLSEDEFKKISTVIL